ncbi:MAG: hypothetical protein L6R38_005198 [Xanthoria sp. 2 TBL-2021]|nr:MAG: hypothetical protein L6R38_005198 [Xanthoria sp. 2 TBL-2021]
MSFCSQYVGYHLHHTRAPDADNVVDAGNYAGSLNQFDYNLNVTRCTNTNPQTLCPNNRFSESNGTCCENNEGIPEINYQNNKPLPTAKADLSCVYSIDISSIAICSSDTNIAFLAYYALAGYTIPTDGVYKTATAASTSSSSTASADSATTSAAAGPSAVTSPEPAPSSSLSTGAKAGIGVGIAAAVLILAATGIFLWMHRCKTVPNDREKPDLPNYQQYSGVPQELGPGQEQNMDNYYKTSELPDEPARMELDSRPYKGGNKPTEMQA